MLHLPCCFHSLNFHQFSPLLPPSFLPLWFSPFFLSALPPSLSRYVPRMPGCLSLVLLSPARSSHWLLLWLPKPMPVCDWWIRSALGHAGSVSMCRQENISFIRPSVRQVNVWGGSQSAAVGSLSGKIYLFKEGISFCMWNALFLNVFT